MAKFLYANFLEDKKAYNLAQGSWIRLLNSLLREYGYTYSRYINQFQNGKKEYDGNPIFSAYIPEIGRGIRIIQVSPTEEGEDLSAWIDKIEIGKKAQEREELVIDIKLSKETKGIAKILVEKWISTQLDKSSLGKILDDLTTV